MFAPAPPLPAQYCREPATVLGLRSDTGCRNYGYFDVFYAEQADNERASRPLLQFVLVVGA